MAPHASIPLVADKWVYESLFSAAATAAAASS
jgi:hypothetical protein